MSEFRPFPWQQTLWRPLAAAIKLNTLSHALLLTGPAGTGKRHFARCLAATLWCRTPGADGVACGECDDCRQVSSEAHSGFHFLRVEEDKRDISIDAVRNLSEKLNLTSHDGRSKIAIIEPADALNGSGVNALLKTIEEPSPGSHLLLISERPQALAATLRSRCQILRCATPTTPEALTWLRENVKSDIGEREFLEALRATYDAPLRAREIIESASLARQREWAAGLLELAAGRSEPLPLATAIGEGNVVAFAQWLYAWLAALLRTQAAPAYASEEAMGALAKKLAPDLLDRYVAEVQDALFRVTTNMNKLLLLESLLIGWVGLLARAARTPQNA